MSKSNEFMPAGARCWRPWQEEFLRKHYATNPTEHLALVLDRPVSRVLAKANKMGLKKSKDVVRAISRELANRPGHASHAFRFPKGNVPANKGMRRPGFAPGQMAKTQFKPGDRPHTWLPVGSYRINRDGALERKLNDLPGPYYVRWKPVHRLVWERAHGPVPAGHGVVFKPGRKTTDPKLITLDAVELLTNAQRMLRNTVHNLPPQIVAVVQLRATLSRQINKLAKEGRTT